MSAADVVAVVFMVGVACYAWLGIADFGAGFWDLTAGGLDRGRRPRALIDSAMTPVYEANHVWLIFLLVLTWTAFGEAFASIMTTLFVPLALAAIGIVLRASNFVFRKEATTAGRRHLTGWWFGVASLLTPFFLGAALGGLITGRVPAGNAAGQEIKSWFNLPSLLIGALVVAIGAYLAATYLVAEANRRDATDLACYFRRRAVATGSVAFGIGVGAFIALRADERRMFDRFVDRSWLLLALSAVALLIACVRTARAAPRGTRIFAALAVGLLVAAWGVAQYPYLLPFDLDIDAGAASSTTCIWVLIWFGVALVTVVPALVFLFVLDQRGEIVEGGSRADATLDARSEMSKS
jgi:cytochrome d ubiquinol oxidase subunit II